ncbi:MAG: hypothetical protein LBC70_07810 [Chitinispirillales bacterium]|jgi:hypothetical protein|nr:hypothetical protein [Chitinispirillales bacterium]
MSIQNFLSKVDALKDEYEKFERGNKAAGTRARKYLQEIKTIAHEMRAAIQAKKSEEQAS